MAYDPKETHKSVKLVYMIYDNKRCEIVVHYKTPAHNTSKAIYSTMASAQKVINQLNSEQGFERFDVMQYRR